MKIFLVGGGSGGHVTPLRAINESLKRLSKEDHDVTVITDRGFYSETTSIFKDDSSVQIKKIYCGKYRRYKSKSFLWHIAHLPTLLKNIRDVFLLGIGFLQSVIYFLTHKPDVVFCKGGFVCIPIGLATKLFSVPLIIHDSDTRPGLTNRILARWAIKIGTGMPTTFYPYPKKLMVYTGIPVNTEYQAITKRQQSDFKEALQLDVNRPLLLVTGGGNGASSLNQQVVSAAPALLDAGFSIVHLVGNGKANSVINARAQLSSLRSEQWQIEEFAEMVPRLLAADIVVSRTSASTLQECANAKKMVIGIASPYLEDQKMNAEYFASKEAIISLDETMLSSDGSDLFTVITELKNSAHTTAKYAENLHTYFAKPAAADTLAQMILECNTSS